MSGQALIHLAVTKDNLSIDNIVNTLITEYAEDQMHNHKNAKYAIEDVNFTIMCK